MSFAMYILGVILFLAIAIVAIRVAFKLKRNRHFVIRVVGKLTMLFGAVQVVNALLMAVCTHITFFS